MHQPFLNPLTHSADKLAGWVKKIWEKAFPPPLPEENTLYGFKRYELPLLVAYSRSGTNWLRYFIEVVSLRPTPGHERYIKNRTDYIIDRAHCGYPIVEKHPRIILLLRNYKECMVRHYSAEKILAYPSVNAFLKDNTLPQPPSWYLKNLLAFEVYQRPKLLVHYEALMLQPEVELRKIADFLQLNKERTEDFIEHLDEHQQKSIQKYQLNQKSVTAGAATQLFYHSKQLPDTICQAFDDCFREQSPYLFDRYLQPYASDRSISK